jgi:hypothetical protein
MVVEPGNCFWALMDYLNPVRAGMVKGADGLESYAWSSVKNYLSAARSRPEWMETAGVFGGVGAAGGLEASHQGRSGIFGGRGEAGIGAASRFAKHASVSGRIGSCVKDGMQ